MPSEPKLTPKQALFVGFYCGRANFNGRLAAELAGYEGDDFTLKAVACENLTKPYIAAAVQAGLAERLMGADEVKARLAEHARGTLTHFIEVSDGGMVTVNLASAEALDNLHLLKKIKPKTRTGGTLDDPWREQEIELELHDPQAALEKLGRVHKLFTDKVEHSGGITVTRTAEELDDNELATIASHTAASGDGATAAA